MLSLKLRPLIYVLLFVLNVAKAFADNVTQSWTLSDLKSQDSTSQISQAADTGAKFPDRGYTRNEVSYNIPDVQMIDRQGNEVALREIINYDGPVMVQFIFTTCSTICPVLSASFASAKRDLDNFVGDSYRLISISIDPEQDTPEQLNEYATRFKAGKNWYFLTGARADIISILKAFDATYAGNNKMYHKSLTFMRSEVDATWVRLEGLLSKNDIVREFKQLTDLSSRPKDHNAPIQH